MRKFSLLASGCQGSGDRADSLSRLCAREGDAREAVGHRYRFGLILATLLLHGVGVGLGFGIKRLGVERGRPVAQTAGALVALVGLAGLAGVSIGY
jgi:hypothetical protein